MSEKIYLGQNASDIDYDEKAERISRVNLSVDSDHIYTSGDDTGRTLEVSCPWGSQAMADSILAKVSGIDYQPYEANDALLDPSAEIGDGITLGGVYSLLAQSSISLDKQCASNISAPYNDEIDDEYPYKSPEQRKVERQIAQTRSMITKTAEEIRLEVSNELDSLSSSIDLKLDGITLETIGADGKVSSVKLFDTGKIDLTGYATFTGLSEGTTTINGGCITTGQVLASYIKLGGYMDLYESLDSSTIAGRFGKTTVTVNEDPYEALGFTSLGNEYMGANGILFQIATQSIFMVGTTGIILNATEDNAAVAINAAGILFNGSVIHYSSSDRTLKKNIRYDRCDELSAAFDCLQPVTFDFENEFMEGQHHIGFIAQDVEEAMENAGFKNTLVAKDNRGKYVMNYGEMVALLTAKIKQLEKRLEVLSA